MSKSPSPCLAWEPDVQQPTEENVEHASLSCISRNTNRHLVSTYAILGRWIAKHPIKVLVGGFCVFLAMIPGTFLMQGEEWLMWMRLDSQFINVFAFQDSKYMDDYKRGASQFEPLREQAITMIPRSASIMDTDFLISALNAESTMRAKKGEYDDKYYGLEDVCSRPVSGGTCNATSNVGCCEWYSLFDFLVPNRSASYLASLHGLSSAALGSQLMQNVPAMRRPMLRLLVSTGGAPWPGASASDLQLGTWLASRTATLSMIKLRKLGELAKHTRAYELEIEGFINEHRDGYGHIAEISCMLELSLGREIAKMCKNALPLIFTTVGIMVLYGVIWLGTQTRKPGQSQRLLIGCAALIPCLASFASFGFLGYLGQPFNVLAFMVPFLGMAMGIDNIFVVTSALKAVGPEKNTEDAVAEAIAEGGSAITTTSITSVLAFLVAVATSLNLPGFVAFNLATMFAVFGNWVGTLTIYTAMLVLNEHRIDAGRCDLRPWKKNQINATGQDSEAHSIFQRLLNPGPAVCKFVEEKYAPQFETSMVFKAVGSTFFFCCFVVGGALYPQVDSGMPDTYMVPDSSYLQDFFIHNEKHFRNKPPMDVHLLIEDMDLTSPGYLHSLQSMLDKVSLDPDVAMVDCWAGMYRTRPVVTEWPVYRRDMSHWSGGIAGFGSPRTAHCHIFFFLSWDAKTRAEQADRLISLVRGSNVQALAYHKLFTIQVGRFHEIQHAMLVTAVAAVVSVYVVLHLFLPPHFAVLATVTMMGTIAALFGYMAIVGSSFNMVTYCSVVMAIGFCVDYATHVCHFADHHLKPGTPWSTRMCCSVKACGYSVGHGCFTAFLGVCLMMFGGSPAFRVFCLNVIIITACGGLLALFGMPSLISLIPSCGSCKPRSKVHEVATALT